jgi:ABC-type glycerol-3-phosphate transport system permease component
VELEEAALIDGADEITIFFRIIFPLSRPMMAAIGLFLAVGFWNDYTSYMYFASGNLKVQPLMYALYRILNESTFAHAVQNAAQTTFDIPKIPAFSLRMASIICSVLPILLAYPFLQKHFAKGILIGAVKG